ncbi:hypothetical protein BH11PAT2_BH11PAT2_07300 [soil metagenome]
MNMRATLIPIVVVIVVGAFSFGIYALATRHTFTNESKEVTSSITAIQSTTTPEVVVATTSSSTPKAPVKVTKPVKTAPVVKAPPVVVELPPAPIITTPPAPVAGYGNLTASLIPLLSGGNARAGTTVPVSYLQITNVGTTTVKLSGFKLKETGSAPDVSIIGLHTVDEKGGSRGSIGGSEATTPFVNGLAEAPTSAILAPGQMKLFTVKVQLSINAGQYMNTQVIIVVTGLDATATTRGSFPIPGTTWTIIP